MKGIAGNKNNASYCVQNKEEIGLLTDNIHGMLLTDNIHGMLLTDNIHGMLLTDNIHGMLCFCIGHYR